VRIFRDVAMSACLALALLPESAAAAGPASLADAVKHGDAAAVRTLLRSGAPADAPEPDGTTPLMWAVRGHDTAIVNLLLGAKANATAVNRYGVTPLILAAENGDAPIVAALLKAGMRRRQTRRAKPH
jgi:uncharacterized protein